MPRVGYWTWVQYLERGFPVAWFGLGWRFGDRSEATLEMTALFPATTFKDDGAVGRLLDERWDDLDS